MRIEYFRERAQKVSYFSVVISWFSSCLHVGSVGLGIFLSVEASSRGRADVRTCGVVTFQSISVKLFGSIEACQ